MKKLLIIFFVTFVLSPLFAKTKNENPSSGNDQYYGSDWNKMDKDFENALNKKKPKKSKPQKKR